MGHRMAYLTAGTTSSGTTARRRDVQEPRDLLAHRIVGAAVRRTTRHRRRCPRTGGRRRAWPAPSRARAASDKRYPVQYVARALSRDLTEQTGRGVRTRTVRAWCAWVRALARAG